MTDETALKGLRNVIVISLVDGELADGEKQFIDMLRTRLGVSDSEFRELVAQVKEDPKTLSLPTSNEEAVETISLLAQAARADGTVSDVEITALRRLAEKVGLDEARLDEILRGETAEPDTHEDEIEKLAQEVYRDFHSWDQATRKSKFDAIGSFGPSAVVPLLRMFESYRTPAGAGDALDMKVLVAAQLGALKDVRCVYYMVQQINYGDVEDEVASAALRHTCAVAIGRCVGEDFSSDDEGVQAAREWWDSDASQQYNQLAF